MLSLAMDIRSSVLPALLFIPLMLVNGVLAPLTEPVGVDVAVGELSPGPPPAFFLAAFSARRFCFEAEGGIFDGRGDRWSQFFNDQSEFKNGWSHSVVASPKQPLDRAGSLGHGSGKRP